MKPMRAPLLFLALVLLPAACDEPPPVATLTEVPAQFVGIWAVDKGACRSGGGPNAATVTSLELVVADTRVQVTGVAPDGENAARVDGHFTGPGAQWDGAVRLELANGGKELNVVNGSTIVPRVKCP